ncbi:MAG: hypothetical protein KJ072_12910 [Verrucomicrobia bacterium]|nr:hypothetical protein [Verrucomicrobiota bacterium]
MLTSSPVRLLTVTALLLFLSSCCEDEPLKEPIRVYGYGAPTALAISPDGRTFISGGPSRAVLREIESGQLRRVLEIGWSRRTDDPPLPTPVNTVTALAFSPDGSRLITAHSDGAARLWEVASGRLVRTLRHPGGVFSASFTPDGRQVLTRTGWDHPGVWLWETATGELLRRFEGYAKGITSVAFSPSGGQVVTGAGHPGAVCLWDVETGQRLQVIQEDLPVSPMAFSPDGRTVLIGCGSDDLLVGYAKGEGVPQDYVEAYKWLTIAARGGLAKAEQYQRTVALEMSAAQIAEALRRSREFQLKKTTL